MPATWGHQRPPVLFIGSGYAGHRARFANLVRNTSADERIDPEYRLVTGWRDDGLLERVPLVPRALKGRIRAIGEAAAFARLPRPEAIWTSAGELFAPYAWSQLGPWRRPLILDVDAVPDQLESWALDYFGRPAKRGARRLAGRLRKKLVWANTTLFVAWSTWAAEGLLSDGIPAAQVTVLPPGVDLEAWQVGRPSRRDAPVRILFVGGDFERKGGPALLSVAQRLRDRCEVDIVTRSTVAAGPGVRVHRAEPNSAALRHLYAEADLFVLPTRAECFGIATIEAMASGLPVIVSDVGGARDIVVSGETGWLIEPTTEALTRALDVALGRRDVLRAMGARAREVAEEKFNGRRNDRKLVDLVLEQVALHRSASRRVAPREVAAR